MAWRIIIAGQSFGPKVKPINRKRSAIQRLNAVFSYTAALAIVASVVVIGYQSPVDSADSDSKNTPSLLRVDNPSLDQLVAADMAAEAAQVADLSIANNASSLSISLSAKKDLAQSSDTVLVKPQIIQGDDPQRGIAEYRVVRGDTVPSVAKKFDISVRTVKWANDLTSDALNPGTKLYIPGTDGVVYRVKSSDTVQKLAKKYKSSADRIVTYNDLELSGLRSGQRIVIPDGILPAGERPQVSTPSTGGSSSSGGSYNPFYGGGGNVGNRYAYGYCTWYAYERRAQLGRPIGSFWGDAITWAGFAQSSGYRVNSTPAIGAVLHDPTIALPWGHVAVVESVNSDGSIIVSEMNYAGWNVVSERTISAAQARAYSYIH